jgi:hypothetical protein
MKERTTWLEWISLVYLLFFVLAVVSPSLITRGYFGLAEDTLEELTIFVFGLAGILSFATYERLMERREKERDQAAMDYQRAKTELIESYTYIGAMNRKIELLKSLANDTTKSMGEGGKRLSKDLFQSLVANACAAAGAEAALLRFLEVEKLRTEREFLHQARARFVFRVANRDLRGLQDQGAAHAFIRTEDGKEVLVVPSDRQGAANKAYLILHLSQAQIAEIDPSLLKVFVNQAEMLYRSLASHSELTAGHTPASVT